MGVRSVIVAVGCFAASPAFAGIVFSDTAHHLQLTADMQQTGTNQYLLTGVQLTMNGVTEAGSNVPLSYTPYISLDHNTPFTYASMFIFGDGCMAYLCGTRNSSLDGVFVGAAGAFTDASLRSWGPSPAYPAYPMFEGQTIGSMFATWSTITTPEPVSALLFLVGVLALAWGRFGEKKWMK